MTANAKLSWRVGVSAMVVAAAILTTVALSAEKQATVIEALMDARHRPSRARLSGPFPYRQYKGFPAIDRQLIEAATAFRATPIPNEIDRLHAAGLADLLLGRTNEGVKLLGLAVQLADAESISPRLKAAILNDFAVAHYEHATHGHRKSFIIGLDAAQRAWTLHRTPAITWTRAVLLESLVSAERASEAWDDYLRLDPSSPWADEIRRRHPSDGDRAYVYLASNAALSLRSADHDVARLLQRARVLDAMRAGDEAWEERIKAAQVTAVAPVTADSVQTALAVAAVRDGYAHAAELLFSLGIEDALRRRDEAAFTRLSRWSAFSQSRIAGDTSDPNLYLLHDGVVEMDATVTRAKARFTSSRRDRMSVSVEGHTVVNLPPRRDWAAAIDDFAPEQDDREAMALIVAESVRRRCEDESRAEIARGSPEAALWLSDRARIVGVPWKASARCIEEQSRASTPAEMGRKLTACVPPGVTLIHQDLDPTRLYTWVVRDGRVELTTTRVSASQLTLDITGFYEAIARDGDGREQGQHLYDILLRPVQRQIAGSGLLVYSPSLNLRGVPVAVLHDGTQFLIERRPVVTTPTISAFELPRTAASGASALVVLPEAAVAGHVLYGARSEVRTVAQIYRGRSMLLTEAAATPETFLKSAIAYGVIHVATHGLTRGGPYQNSIEFGQARMRAYDVFTLDLKQKPIVMLAACRTADSSGGPMNVGLAEAFLAAGASAVIGSLWDVEDLSTEQLSVAFHRELARGATPHDALRTVQLQFIRRGMPVSVWAAFQVSS